MTVAKIIDGPRPCDPQRAQKGSELIQTANVEMTDVEGKPIHAHGGSFLEPDQAGGKNKKWW